MQANIEHGRHISSCVDSLLALKPNQRPASVDRLASWIKGRPCNRIKVAIPDFGPLELSAALLSKLNGDRVLHQALVPFTCVLAPESSEPAVKRQRKTWAVALAQVDEIAERTMRRLRLCKHAFVGSSVSARHKWLQSQCFVLSVIEPKNLILHLLGQQVIRAHSTGRITYNSLEIDRLASSNENSRWQNDFSIRAQEFNFRLLNASNSVDDMGTINAVLTKALRGLIFDMNEVGDSEEARKLGRLAVHAGLDFSNLFWDAPPLWPISKKLKSMLIPWKVLCEDLPVRQQATKSSKQLDLLHIGEISWGTQEADWLRLHNNLGYVRIKTKSKQLLAKLPNLISVPNDCEVNKYGTLLEASSVPTRQEEKACSQSKRRKVLLS